MVEGLAVDLVHLDGSALLMVRGEIDVASAPVFSGAMQRVLSLGVPVVLDFAGVTFMDSCGLKVLLRAQRDGGADFLGLRNPSPQVRRLLAITGVDSVVDTDASAASEVTSNNSGDALDSSNTP